jgi:hypothetical protein
VGLRHRSVVVVPAPGGRTEADDGATGALSAGSPEYGESASELPVLGSTSKACCPGLTNWYCSRAMREISVALLRFFRSCANAASCWCSTLSCDSAVARLEC